MADEVCVWLFGYRSTSVGASLDCAAYRLYAAVTQKCHCSMRLVALYKCYMPMPYSLTAILYKFYYDDDYYYNYFSLGNNYRD